MRYSTSLLFQVQPVSLYNLGCRARYDTSAFYFLIDLNKNSGNHSIGGFFPHAINIDDFNHDGNLDFAIPAYLYTRNYRLFLELST